MKLVDTTQETATSWSPYKVETKKFLQDLTKEMVYALCRNVVTNHGLVFSPTVPYFFAADLGLDAMVGDGFIFYGNELYRSKENTAGDPYAFVDLTPNAVADPTTFSDNTNHNIHLDRYLNYQSGATGSLFPVANIVNVSTFAIPSYITPTLAAGWSGTNSNVVRYKSVGTTVFISGSINNPTSGTGTIFTLQAGYRPTAIRTIPTTVFDGTTFMPAIISITTGGAVSILPSIVTNLFVYFESCSFEI